MPHFLQLGNARYLDLDAIVEVRLTPDNLVHLLLTNGRTREIPLDLAGDLLAWCAQEAAVTQAWLHTPRTVPLTPLAASSVPPWPPPPLSPGWTYDPGRTTSGS